MHRAMFALFLLTGSFQGLCQKYTQSQDLIRVDLDHDSKSDWRATLAVRQNLQGTVEEYYIVSVAFIISSATSRILLPGSGRSDFTLGQTIDAALPASPSIQVILLAYDWTVWTDQVGDFGGEFRSQDSAILAAKHTDPGTGDVRVGWFKVSRASVTPGTAFTLESWAYNPIPNEPIRAGFPPDLPEPQFTFSGETGETLDVSWPAKASMLRLETTDSLTPPVQWKPVDTGGATTVTLPAGEAQGAFFRLVAPEL
jgi:hypothetical protein